MTVVLIDVALAALLLVVVARARTARRQPRARIAWLAAVIGAVALLTQGTLIPLPVMDGLLGGTNILKLVQNVLTMVALWLGIHAGTAPLTARVRTLRWGLPALLAAVFAAVFFVALPERGSSSFHFIEDAVRTSTGAWVYGVVHMAGIAALGVLLCRSARRSLPGVRPWFRVGAIGIVIGCASEIVDLTLTRFFTANAVVSALFDPLFYLGVLAFVIGILRASYATASIRRRGGALLDELESLARTRGIGETVPGDGTDARLHALRVAVEDHAISTSRPLDTAERRVIDAVDVHLTRDFSGARP
ncbi:hypothetical protein ACIPVB_15390 [Microbacterium sp. NPDC090007]|uniref:hypothetical protein n=1 Tax=Microbacterium sp. NPDC090007 TaxID=3364204 RepID=UPI003813EC60